MKDSHASSCCTGKAADRARSGQALLEYIFLIAILISLYSLLVNTLAGSKAFDSLKKPLTKDFAYTYRYGHPQARGQEDGGPKYIPQQHEDTQNFRIFINPPINE